MEENKKVQEEKMIDKVLIVDDSDLIHSMYKLMLRKYKCDIVTAKNGKEALDKLAIEKSIDLILLDVNMPVMNGISFLQALKDDSEHSEIPVIVISTEGKEDDTIRALKLGASGYIVKPFKSEQLYLLIERLFEQRTAKTG